MAKSKYHYKYEGDSPQGQTEYKVDEDETGRRRTGFTPFVHSKADQLAGAILKAEAVGTGMYASATAFTADATEMIVKAGGDVAQAVSHASTTEAFVALGAPAVFTLSALAKRRFHRVSVGIARELVDQGENTGNPLPGMEIARDAAFKTSWLVRLGRVVAVPVTGGTSEVAGIVATGSSIATRVATVQEAAKQRHRTNRRLKEQRFGRH